MSENIIYCYSGTGNCLDIAKNIARDLGDTDIVMMRSAPSITDATGAKRVGFVFSCMGGGLPGNVEKFIKSIRVSDDAYTFGVASYAGYMGCGLYKIDKIIGLDYWTGISHHSTAIWLMPHNIMMPPLSVGKANGRSAKKAAEISKDVKALKHSKKKPPRRTINAAESALFPLIAKKKARQYTVNDRCVGCGQCAAICPTSNIRMVNDRPQFGKNCIGCLSCIQMCPNAAIDVGKITAKRERFHNPNISAADLMEKVIHID